MLQVSGISACLVSRRRLSCPPCVPAGAGRALPGQLSTGSGGVQDLGSENAPPWALQGKQGLCQAGAVPEPGLGWMGGMDGPAGGFGSTLRHHQGSVVGQAMHNFPLCAPQSDNFSAFSFRHLKGTQEGWRDFSQDKREWF